MKKFRLHSTVSLILNALNFVLVLISILWFFSGKGASGDGNMGVGGTRCFRFFTNDSNILCGLISLAMIPFNIRGIRTGKPSIPRAMTILKFIGTAAVALTLTVVVVFLGPTQGYDRMFSGVCLELHLLCPLLAIISFCFFERGNDLSKKDRLFALIPTFIYGTVYLILVVFAGVWEDFYGFNIGGVWPGAYVALHLLTFFLAILLRRMHNGRASVSVKTDR